MAKKDRIKAVEDAEKLADKMWKERYGDNTAVEPPAAVTPEPTPVVTPEPVPVVTPEPVPVEPAAPVVPDALATALKAKEELEHKLAVLQGKYNAEVPGMAFELAQTRIKISELETKLTEASKPKEPVKEVFEDIDQDPKVQEFKKEYPEFYEGVKFLATTMADIKIRQINDRVKKVEEDVTNVGKAVKEKSKDEFVEKIDKDPDVGKEWRILSKDEKFLDWLDREKIYGKTKQELLTDAWNRKDAEAVIQCFKDYKGVRPAAPSPPAPPAEKKPTALDIDPSRGGTGGPVDTKKIEAREPIVDRKALKQFYQDQASGLWRGREEEAEKEELRLLKAIGVVK